VSGLVVKLNLALSLMEKAAGASSGLTKDFTGEKRIS
jgi:hypothetical protein